MHLSLRWLMRVSGCLALVLMAGCIDKPSNSYTYSNNPAIYTKGVAIAANTASVSGATVSSYSVSRSLPAGLALNAATGVITGTPTLAVPAATYVVTAVASSGNLTCNLNITVNDSTNLVILVQPSNQSVAAGQTALFAVSAVSPGTLSYQWLQNGTPIAGATSTNYTTPATVLADSGAIFSVTVRDTQGGLVTSTTATLTVVTAPLNLAITEQPLSKRVLTGATATFSVIATGKGTLSYQWLQDGTSLAGATSANYTTTVTAQTHSGTAFRVIVSDTQGGSVTSTQATLRIVDVLPSAGTWLETTGGLAAGRYLHTATLLPSGEVLIAGGYSTSPLASAELYDPYIDTFTSTNGSMKFPRYSHTATVLPDNKVLIVGGVSFNNLSINSSELYDPTVGTFSLTTGPMLTSRDSHTATLLSNGKVLVVGGWDGKTYFGTAELYDPGTKNWTSTKGSLIAARAFHTATLLTSGQVLITGGYNITNGNLASAELYNPDLDTFTATASMVASRADHTATTLANGMVLLVGGTGPAELYNPATKSFFTTASLGTTRLYFHSASLLASGKVLIVGGVGSSKNVLPTAEQYDAATGVFSDTGSLFNAREAHTATVLQGGEVLVVGGYETGLGFPRKGELYQ